MSSERQIQRPRMREGNDLWDNGDDDDRNRDDGDTSSSPAGSPTLNTNTHTSFTSSQLPSSQKSSINPTSQAAVTSKLGGSSSLPRSVFMTVSPGPSSSIGSLRETPGISNAVQTTNLSNPTVSTAFVTITVASAAALSGTLGPSLVDQGGSAGGRTHTTISPTTTPIENAQVLSPVAQRVLIALGCISIVAIIAIVLLLVRRRKNQQGLTQNPEENPNTILRSQASMRTTIETGLFGADPHALRPTTLASGDSIPGIKRTKNPFADPPLAKTYDMLFGRPRSPTLADTRVYESRDPFMDPPEIRMDVSERRTGGATVRI